MAAPSRSLSALAPPARRVPAPARRLSHPGPCPDSSPTCVSTAASTSSTEPRPTPASERAPTDTLYDAVVVGAGFGGLAAATQMAVAGAKVAVLER